MTIEFECPTCGKTLRAKDEAVGKKGRCRDCGEVFRVPELAEDDDDLFEIEPKRKRRRSSGGSGGGQRKRQQSRDPWDTEEYDTDDDEMLGNMDLSRAYGQQLERPRECPVCGEEIARSAQKCRHCGEILDKKLRRREERRNRSYSSNDDSEMTGGDWVVAILCSGIGCIAGVVWMIQGKPKGSQMVVVSIVADIVKSGIGMAIRAMNEV